MQKDELLGNHESVRRRSRNWSGIPFLPETFEEEEEVGRISCRKMSAVPAGRMCAVPKCMEV